jgi:hypothetical protein
MTTNELLVLRAMRLKGRVDADGLTSATRIEPAEASRIAARLVSAGEAREVSGNYILLTPGRERLATLLEDERTAVDADAITAVHENFVEVNGDFKQLASDWQLRDGETPNDHTDAAYDENVINRLPGIHQRVMPVVAEAAALVPRLEHYRARLASALERVQAGDSRWLLSPLIDSYHTVWFELHEDLIGLAGLSRQSEAVSGRAE